MNLNNTRWQYIGIILLKHPKYCKNAELSQTFISTITLQSIIAT